MGTTIRGAILLALLALTGCDSTYHARVSDGAGMGEGSPVLVSGVQVGEVKSIAIMEGEVDVEFSISSDHEITLRNDTCVLAVRGEDGSGLVLVAGEGSPLTDEQAERPLPECHLPGQELEGIFNQLGDMLGSMIRAFGQGLSGPQSPGGPVPPTPQIPQPQVPAPPMPIPSPTDPNAPPPPPPPPAPVGGACQSVSVRVERVEAVSPVPILLAQGGHRVWFVFQNDGDQALRVGSVTQATFTAGSETLTVAQLPSENQSWFMPFDVAAHSTARVSVVFETSAEPRVTRVEARQSSPAQSPLDQCTIVANL